MASEVFFTDLRTGPGNNLLVKLENLVSTAGIGKIGFRDKFVAIKIHFGEYGNMAYLRPNYAAVIVRMIQNLGGKPFLTACIYFRHTFFQKPVFNINKYFNLFP